MKNISERRLGRRYKIRVSIRFRVAKDGTTSEWRVGRTCNLSNSGVSFRCRHSLPPDSHIEMIIHWPSKQAGIHPVFLRAAGQVVRSRGEEVAVWMTSSRFVVEKTSAAASNSTL